MLAPGSRAGANGSGKSRSMFKTMKPTDLPADLFLLPNIALNAPISVRKQAAVSRAVFVCRIAQLTG